MEPPNLINFLDMSTGQLDYLGYCNGLKDFDESKRLSEEAAERPQKRPFKPRMSYYRRNPKDSVWWTDYVVDAGHTFCDPTHRNGKFFRHRFSHTFDSVHELVKKIREPEHYFWRNATDASGKDSSPLELLVLGSLRILTRNVTLDDLFEQTFISGEVHRNFFVLFVGWYSHG
jgi:hypothetical protein